MKKVDNTCVSLFPIYVYNASDDLTDPAPATTFAHLDATTVLSRSIAELGIYPAVDPLDSTSRMLDARIIGQEHYDTARNVQKTLQDYKNLQVGTRRRRSGGGKSRVYSCIVLTTGQHCKPNCRISLQFLEWTN